MQLEEQVALAVSGRLQNLGWTRVDDDEPQFELDEGQGVVFGLSLNMAVREYGVVLYPALGVSPSCVYGLYSTFRGLPPSSVSSIGTGLADLLFAAGLGAAPARRWHVASADGLESVVHTFCEDLKQYGMPYCRSLSTVDAVIMALEGSNESPEELSHLAIAYASEGRGDEALSTLEAYLESSAGQPLLMTEKSRQFARSFLSYFKLNASEFLRQLLDS